MKDIYELFKCSYIKTVFSHIQVKLDHCNDDIAANEREIRSLRRQLETTEAELVETNRIKENLSRDNRRFDTIILYIKNHS